MTSLMTRSVIMFMCLVIVAQCGAEDLPIRFEDYLAMFNGHFDNIQQGEDRLHDVIEIRGKPVVIPGLQKGPAAYCVETMNGHVYRRVVGVRNESSTDRILYVNYYNFTDSSQYNHRTFNTDDLTNLTREDFRLDEGCQASFTKLSPGVLFGEVLDCRHAINGQHPVYTMYVTCDSIRVEPPLAADETTSLVAYDFKRRNPRCPLIDPPEDCVIPCKDGL